MTQRRGKLHNTHAQNLERAKASDEKDRKQRTLQHLLDAQKQQIQVC